LSVLGPAHIAVLLPVATSQQAIANLEINGNIAVCVSSPTDFRTVQLKGRSLHITECSNEDVILSEQQRSKFAAAILKIGVSRQKARNLWLFDSWRVEVEVRTVYAQTPGPGAGAPLEGGQDA